MGAIDKSKSSGDRADRPIETDIEKVQTTVAAVQEAVPYLKEAGYLFSRIAVEVGDRPKILLTLRPTTKTNTAKLDALTSAHGDKPVLCRIINALKQANAFQSKIRVRNQVLGKIEVELGESTSVRLHFSADREGRANAKRERDKEKRRELQRRLSGNKASPGTPPPGEPKRVSDSPRPKPPIPSKDFLEEAPPLVNPDPPRSSSKGSPGPTGSAKEAPPVEKKKTILVTDSHLHPILTDDSPSPPTNEDPTDVMTALKPIFFRCPDCRQKYKVEPKKAGRSLTCKHCGKKVIVPRKK